MVVGIQTLLDAELYERDIKERGRGIDVLAPVGAAVSGAVGVYLPGAEILDVGGGRPRQSERKTHANFFAPGEQVYAVQYRKIEFSWFFSKKLETARLEKGNRWKVYWLRSAAVDDDEHGEEDVVEAQVNDTLSTSDLALVGGYEHFDIDGENEIFFAL